MGRNGGVIGARMTGGGFGGSTVTLCESRKCLVILLEIFLGSRYTGSIGNAPGQPGPDRKGIGVVGTHYSRYDDYRAGLPDSPIHIKPKTNYGSIYDPLQNNKSVGGIRGGIHEVDTADYLATPANGYDLLQLGRKFMTDTERFSDIDAVAFERSLGHLHFIQAKSSNRALQGGMADFARHMNNQLAQLTANGDPVEWCLGPDATAMGGLQILVEYFQSFFKERFKDRLLYDISARQTF